MIYEKNKGKLLNFPYRTNVIPFPQRVGGRVIPHPNHQPEQEFTYGFMDGEVVLVPIKKSGKLRLSSYLFLCAGITGLTILSSYFIKDSPQSNSVEKNRTQDSQLEESLK